eukprot:TRINITY_DN36319_c0_g1_i2.p1 TRINITY_DN36319_c0_g1~~TRINITY_DN36319_c0_g1_i2.p1  ORF type:complete len:237 (+),score=51.64 TRINITY_DN36319_c0_g1_i2:439-1149(+)
MIMILLSLEKFQEMNVMKNSGSYKFKLKTLFKNYLKCIQEENILQNIIKKSNFYCNIKLNGQILEEECNDIIKYMYNEEDAQFLLNKLEPLYAIMKPEINKRKMTREEENWIKQEKDKLKIDYSLFQKTILDFQLRTHEKFLKNFLNIFNSIHSETNGIINEQEFRELLRFIGADQDEENIVRMLSLVDPNGYSLITFSQCVSLLSSEIIIDNNGNNLSILQKLSLENFDEYQNEF